MFDDEMRSQMRSQSGRSQKSICRKSFLFKVFACIFQLGPILYYIRALIEGIRFRKEKNAKEARKHFCKNSFAVYVQIVSLLLSLSSACWSISIQHRSLRLCRPDKVNMHPHESVLQSVKAPFNFWIEMGIDRADGRTRRQYTIALR
ncbi:unnamed protein product, partial [Mesorhabditis belari]|uniref:XK-related protein n=1 Tax=Mesorhabditis belari TaxID=2138241 RepID=A0AAF3FPN2_9BILA